MLQLDGEGREALSSAGSGAAATLRSAVAGLTHFVEEESEDLLAAFEQAPLVGMAFSMLKMVAGRARRVKVRENKPFLQSGVRTTFGASPPHTPGQHTQLWYP